MVGTLKQVPQLWRLGVLAMLLGGGVLVLGRAIATPKAATSSSESAVTRTAAGFPQSIPGQSGSFTQTGPVKSEKGELVGQTYQLQAGSAAITVEVREESGDGNVSRFLFVHTPIRTANSTLQLRFREGVGHYGVLTHAGKAYLSACVNPRGGSTVTEQQFTQNRYQYDLTVGRLLPWFAGQGALLDRRCIWTLMSVPMDKTTPPDDAYKTLEAAWFSWHQWWQSNFPRA
jgi:cyanosortase A-associated protein